MFSFLPLVAILASSILSVNASTYIGCTDSVIVGSSNPPGSVQGNVGKCESYCTNSYPNPYFYYREDSQLCYCSDASPDAQVYVQGASDQGGCVSTAYYQVYARTTSFEFQGCASNMITDNAPPNVIELEDCFAACASEGSAMFLPLYNDDLFACRCNIDNTIEGKSPTTCGPNVWFTFTHSAGATASGLARRNLKERLIALRRQSQTLCPKAAKACSVPGSETYECIDTSSELESCGGCMFGEFQSSNNVTLGTDCSSLPGVARGAVTCYNSQCEAFACKKGYELVSGHCAPIS
ncbi:hypothetical protein I302_101534 [Kwoniella bestiolae CBS 10118]|uniref:Protein CPL1-like domain-containing protein n=1 Tax=Kwoniella bestiolae CBS 10118 TaxID=1296100 RepID=A0A1B9GCI0_9TREE|nr:hypothetical protein I302_00218 [Kwoniella bestiolae CBS 10118]OCF28729.1 hypothetical protein I302_00218 [Kwoniella bestiolae CBS 10118]